MVKSMTHKYDHTGTRTVLRIIAENAGQGITAAQILARCSEGTIGNVNSILSRGKARGWVYRGGKVRSVSAAGRKSRSYLWFITAAGRAYLTPPSVPVITPLAETPNVQRILELLKEAGEEGMRGPDLARHFTLGYEPSQPFGNLQRRMSHVNSILDRMWKRGRVERGAEEPSPWYHNVPAYRWFLTEEGAAYLAGGCYPGHRERKRVAAELAAKGRAQRLREAADAITQAYIDFADPDVVPACEREAAILRLRAAGATLESVGDVFGITRERVRQIQVGFKISPCRCPKHDPPMIPVSELLDSWWAERMTGKKLDDVYD